MKVYLLALFTLVSCGSADLVETQPQPKREHRPKTAITNEQVKEIYEEFTSLCNTYSSSICAKNINKLRFIKIVNKKELNKYAENSDSNVSNPAGLCVYYYSPKTKAIVESYIYLLNDNGYGENWFPLELKALVFHELGHCLLQVDHPKPARPNNNPAIMNWRMYSHETYIKHWDEMVNELFTDSIE